MKRRLLALVLLLALLGGLPAQANASRLFVAASTQYLSTTTVIAADVPLTMACWYRATSVGTGQCLMSIGQSASNNNRFALNFSSTGECTAISKVGGTTGTGTSTTTVGTGVWAHYAGVFGSTTSRDALQNGAGKGSNTTSMTMSGLTQTTIGKVSSSSANNYADGDIAHCAWWSVALTDAEVLELARGKSPLLVRPDQLLEYVPMTGISSPSVGVVASTSFTLNGSPTKSDNPPIFYPRMVAALPKDWRDDLPNVWRMAA